LGFRLFRVPIRMAIMSICKLHKDGSGIYGIRPSETRIRVHAESEGVGFDEAVPAIVRRPQFNGPGSFWEECWAIPLTDGAARIYKLSARGKFEETLADKGEWEEVRPTVY